MDVIDPGHFYSLKILDRDPMSKKEQLLSFVKREGPGYPGNTSHHEGTTTQEVLRALIDRAQYVNNQIPHRANDHAIWHFRNVIYDLEKRAAERHHRLEIFETMFDIDLIETYPTCDKCNHIGCGGECHG